MSGRKTLIRKIVNGNYMYVLFSDGTKIRGLPENEEYYKPAMPENIDIKLTNKCNVGCAFCHENSTSDGEENIDIVDQMRKLHICSGEVALGGGAISSIPTEVFYNIISVLYSNNVAINITINQLELRNEYFTQRISDLLNNDYIKSVGVSINSLVDLEILERFHHDYADRIVAHTIYGVTPPEVYAYLMKHRYKILVLGYKNIRRGEEFLKAQEKVISRNQKWVDEHLVDLSKNTRSLSFDCLAVKQLNMKEKLSDKEWERSYMGDDGTFTMYLDLVKGEYAIGSSSPESERFKIKEDDTIEKMFKHITEVALSKTQN